MKDHLVLMRILPKQCPNAKFVWADREYLLPTKRWITEDLGKVMGQVFKSIPWIEDKFDCNSFALVTTGIAKLCWAQTKSEKAALAFGYAYYTVMRRVSLLGELKVIGRHAVNVAVINIKGEYKLCFFEPQETLKEIKLCDEELLSVSDVVFS